MFGVLAGAPVRQPDGRRSAPAVAWEHRSREAGIVGTTRAEWHDRLTRLATAKEAEAEARLADDARPPPGGFATFFTNGGAGNIKGTSLDITHATGKVSYAGRDDCSYSNLNWSAHRVAAHVLGPLNFRLATLVEPKRR